MNNKKGKIITLIIIVLLVLIVFGLIYLKNNSNNTKENDNNNLTEVKKDETKDEEEGMSQATLCNLQNSSIASSGAAFVVKNISPTTHPKIRKADIQTNLTNLLNEII